MMNLRTIVAITVHYTCNLAWNNGFSSLDELVRGMNRLICLGQLRRVEPLPRGEFKAVLNELVAEGLVEEHDFGWTHLQYKSVPCDVLECDHPATQWSEINPEEKICHICAEIEGDRL